MILRKIVQVVTGISSIVCIIILVFPHVIQTVLGLNLEIDLADVSAIGVIGAADGVTSIIVGEPNRYLIFAVISMLITIIGSAYLIKTNRNNKKK